MVEGVGIAGEGDSPVELVSSLRLQSFLYLGSKNIYKLKSLIVYWSPLGVLGKVTAGFCNN